MADLFRRLGIFFGIWWAFDLILKVWLYRGELDFLWICSINLLLLGYALYRRNGFLLQAFLSISLIVQSVWIIDYVGIAFLGHPTNYNADYVFTESWIEFLNSQRHLFMIPVALFGWMSFGKPEPKNWRFVVLYLFAILLVVRLMTAPEYNINCVYEPCGTVLEFGLPGWQFLSLYLVGMLGTTFILDRIMYWVLQRYRNRMRAHARRTFQITMALATVLLLAGTLYYVRVS